VCFRVQSSRSAFVALRTQAALRVLFLNPTHSIRSFHDLNRTFMRGVALLRLQFFALARGMLALAC
jgi:hypothetical protein